MDIEKARFNMIEQQIRPWQVLNTDVEKNLFAVKREQFVPVQYRNLAFADTEIPLGYGAHMLSPGVEARIVNALHLKKSDHVLEIGTGSGYMAALLAINTRHVDTIEIVPALADTARANLARAKVANVKVITGDGLDPAAVHDSYDVIVVSGALPLVPQHLTANLKIGGRMVVIVGDELNMVVQLLVRGSESSCNATSLFETVAPALKSGAAPSTFAL